MPDIPGEDPFGAVRDELRQFMKERDWEQFHDPKNLAMLLASEAGELLGVLRWVDNRSADDFAAREANRERLASEIADVAIALILLTERMNLDLVAAIRNKMDTNRRHYPVELSRGISERPPR